MKTLDIMEETALSVMESVDCAIGYEAANMVYKGLIGYRDDYIEHTVFRTTVFQKTGWMKIFRIF